MSFYLSRALPTWKEQSPTAAEASVSCRLFPSVRDLVLVLGSLLVSVQGKENVAFYHFFPDGGISLSFVFLPQCFLQGSMAQPSVIKMPILFPHVQVTKAYSDINRKLTAHY